MSRLESGDFIIRKKRQRNMQKIGVGGFYVKARGPKILNMKDEEERQELAAAAAQAAAASALAAATATAEGGPTPLTPLTPGTPVTPTEDGHTPATTDPAFAVPGDKPKKKTVRRNKKYKLIEAYPVYLQESFFGRELMDGAREGARTEGEEDREEPPPEEEEEDEDMTVDVFTVHLS